MLNRIQKQFAQLTSDQAGAVLSMELLMLATTVLLGLLIGFTSTRDAVVSEISDVAGSVQDFNQSFSIFGVQGHGSSTSGSDYQDALDQCDSPDDPSGSADNCVTFGVAPTQESDPATFILSDPNVLDIDNAITGVGGSATGTIGDGTIDTGFTVTTDTGNIAGTTGGSEIRFRENDLNSGTFTITYDDPLTEFEFWIRNLANITGSPENLLGNFTLTLSDGSVINNADFSILPDAIAPNQSFGLFQTRNNDTSLLTTVTRMGLDYVTDPAFDGSGNQASGRIVFSDIPNVGDPPVLGAVGLLSISFDRSGGPNNFQAAFGTSGRVLLEQ